MDCKTDPFTTRTEKKALYCRTKRLPIGLTVGRWSVIIAGTLFIFLIIIIGLNRAETFNYVTALCEFKIIIYLLGNNVFSIAIFQDGEQDMQEFYLCSKMQYRGRLSFFIFNICSLRKTNK